VGDVKPKHETDGNGDLEMANGHAEARVKAEKEGNEDIKPTISKAKSRRVTFDDEPTINGKKRTAATEEDDDLASEEEPPTKKQRKKGTATKVSTKQQHGNKKAEQDSDLGESAPTAIDQTNHIKQEHGEDGHDGSTAGASKSKKSEKPIKPAVKTAAELPPKAAQQDDVENTDDEQDSEAEATDSDEQEKPVKATKAREKVQSTLKSINKDPYPDWKPGEPVPYAALCTTFSKIELTTKRLEISAHCSLFLRQVARLSPDDLLPTVLLMLGKLAADYAGVELGIGESLIMKAIGETTGRSQAIIKSDQQEIGDLGLVAAKSRANQPTMFKPKPLTVRGVFAGLMEIARVEGKGSQDRKISGIKKLLSAADVELLGRGKVDITQDKGGPSESKFIVRTLEGKMRLGLADKTVLVALAQAMVWHEVAGHSDKMPSTEQIANGENIMKNVYK